MSSRRLGGFAQVSAPDSLASDTAIKTPEHGYAHSVYMVAQHNALHEHLQAQLQLHLHQNDRCPQVAEIAELLHKQAMMSQRTEWEAMADGQVAATQELANREHEAEVIRLQTEANRRFMEASIEAHSKQIKLQQQDAESLAEEEEEEEEAERPRRARPDHRPRPHLRPAHPHLSAACGAG